MSRFTYRFGFEELGIDPLKIGRLIDYDRGEDKEHITAIIEDVLAEASSICDIKAEFAVFTNVKHEKVSGILFVNDIPFNVGKIVRSQMRNIDSAAVFTCTAGNEIGERAGSLVGEKDFLRGYILDLAGSEIVESAADVMQSRLTEMAEAQGKHVTNRYSPGYCGWDVMEQHKLFSLLPGNFCGITLTESALMIPIKSVSGIIGIGKNAKYNNYTCSLCDDQNCIYRRLKENIS